MPVQKISLGSHLEGAAGRPVAIGCVRGRVMVGCEAPAGIGLSLGDDFVRQVRIWDFEAGRPVGPWIADDDGFEKAAIGELAGQPVLVCGGYGGGVRVWDPLTGKLIYSLNVGGGWVQALALCEHDGRLIVVASNGDHVVQAWDPARAETVSPRFGIFEGLVYAVAAGYPRSDPVIAVIDNEGTYLWNMAKREREPALPTGEGRTGYGLAIGRLAGRPVLVSIREEHGQRQAYRDRWGNTTSTYSVATLWNLSKKPAPESLFPFPITRTIDVAIGEISSRPAIVSIYDEGLPRTKDNYLFVWYPEK